MSRKNQKLDKTLLEVKSEIADLRSLVKEMSSGGIYRLRCPPYDIIILENNVD